MLIKIRNNFITGVAIIFPLFITIVIARFFVVRINSYMLNPLVRRLDVVPYITQYTLFIAKVLIFFIVILLISIVGWAANIIFLRRLFALGEKIFVKVPLIGKIYSVTKEIGSAFIGQEKAFFKKVVLIEYPRIGVYSIGFLTGEGKGEMRSAKGRGLVSIFVPTTPNPTSGMFLLVPKDDVKPLDMSVEEGLKIIVSSGTVVPSELR